MTKLKKHEENLHVFIIKEGSYVILYVIFEKAYNSGD